MNERVAWITGGAKGIGLGIARRLVTDGWAVAINDIDDASLATAGAELEALGTAVAIRSDITVRSDVEKTVARIERELGPLSALVNNAFWVRRGTILDTSDEDWAKTIDTGLTGYFLCSQVASRAMSSRGTGRVVNLSAGLAERGIPGTFAYASSKGGVNAMSRSMAVDLAPHGITVNVVTTGPIETEAFHIMANDAEQVRSRIARVPLGRLGTVEDASGLVAFLLSPEASWITGGLFHVDGGANGAALVKAIPQ